MSVKVNPLPLNALPPPLDGHLALMGFRKVKVVTGNITIDISDSGTLFVANGAGAVTFTINTSRSEEGAFYGFFSMADQNMAITSGTTNIVALNNASVTTVTYSTAGEKIGAAALLIGAPRDTNKWLLLTGNKATATLT